MENIQIKTQSLPHRCDICHQIDQFNPATGVCLRCANVEVPTVEKQTLQINNQDHLGYSQEAKTVIQIITQIGYFLIAKFIFHLGIIPSFIIGFILAMVTLVLITPLGVMRKGKYPKDIDIVAANLTEFEDLAKDKLELYTKELEAKGFVRDNDYKQRIGTQVYFFRLFYNQELKCFAELFGGKLGSQGITLNFTNYTTQGHSINTNNGKLTYMNYILPLPYKAMFYYPGYEVADLLEKQLQLRNQLVSSLKTALLSDVSADHYLTQVKKQFRHLIKIYEEKIYLTSLLQALWFKLFPTSLSIGFYRQIPFKDRRAIKQLRGQL